MAGRASIVGAAVTHVGNVRDHNEDAHLFDADLGVFLVCDGMGGHAAGEVASEIAIRTIREKWAEPDTQEVADVWLDRGTAIAKKQLIVALRDGVVAAHEAILAEGVRDPTKQGMGTTLVGAVVVGNELIFAHAGDSRAYIVRDGIAMQLTEDHTLLQRLLAAGIDVDVSGDGSRFRSMLTNALGIGQECKVSTFVVPLADGDRFMLCSDGISEYVEEAEVGEVLVTQPSPARAAQKLVDLALERGGGDNATAIVVRVLEAGETPVPAEQRRRDDLSISLCELWGSKISPQQRLRALRIAIPRDHEPGERLPAHTLGDRVAWIVVEGEVNQDGEPLGPGALIYPESLVAGSQSPDKASLAVARTEVRAVAIRNDDFRELCEDDAELGEALLESLGEILAALAPAPARSADPQAAVLGRAETPPVGLMVQPEAVPEEVPEAVTNAVTETAPRDEPSEPEIQILRAQTLQPELQISAVIAVEDGPEAQLASMARPVRQPRPPTAPEIETVVEIEAEEPGPDAFESGEHAMISVSRDDGYAKVIETLVETSSATMQVTVEEPTRARPVTADDADAISGTIEPSKTRRANARPKRQTDGWED